MFWFLTAYLLGAEAGSKRAYADRDENGMPICGGCRNQVDEQATTCEHCSAKLIPARRVGLTTALFVGLGVGCLGTGLLFSLVALFVENGWILILLLFGPLSVLGCVSLYPAYQIQQDNPARELNLTSRLPAFIVSRLSRIVK